MKKIFIILMCTLLSSCFEEPRSVVVVSGFKVEFLFEHDGCKVYRFPKSGAYAYYSDCRGEHTDKCVE